MQTIKNLFKWIVAVVKTTAQLAVRPFIAAARSATRTGPHLFEAGLRAVTWIGLVVVAVFFPAATVTLTIFKVLAWLDVISLVLIAALTMSTLSSLSAFKTAFTQAANTAANDNLAAAQDKNVVTDVEVEMVHA